MVAATLLGRVLQPLRVGEASYIIPGLVVAVLALGATWSLETRLATLQRELPAAAALGTEDVRKHPDEKQTAAIPWYGGPYTAALALVLLLGGATAIAAARAGRQHGPGGTEDGEDAALRLVRRLTQDVCQHCRLSVLERDAVILDNAAKVFPGGTLPDAVGTAVRTVELPLGQGRRLRVEQTAPPSACPCTALTRAQTVPWAAFEDSILMMLLIDGTGQAVAANRAFRKTFGYTVEDLSRLGWRTALGDGVRHLPLEAVRAAPQWLPVVAPLRARSGETVLTQITVRICEDPTHGEVHLVTLEDIAARLETERNAAIAQALLDRIPLGILLLTDEGLVESANRTAETILRRRAEEFVGLPVPFLIRMDPLSSMEAETVRRYGSVLTDGRRTPVWVEEITVTAGQTEERRALLLGDASESLRRDAAVQEAMRRALPAETARPIIHRLRQPLHAIALTAEVAATANAPGHEDVALPERMERILLQIEEVNRLLDAWRRTVPPLDGGTGTTMRTAVGTALRILDPELQAAGLRVDPDFDVGVDSPLPVDTMRLTQAVVQLLENAMRAVRLRHGEQAARFGQIGISCRLLPGNGHVRLEVADNGCGFHRVDQPTPLEAFFSAWPDGSHAGLGMTYCAHLATSAGGSLFWDSDATGSIVRLDLPPLEGTAAPLSRADTDAPEADPAVGPDGDPDTADGDAAPDAPHGRPRILLVDDEGLPLMMIEEHLQARGYDVDVAYDGGEAIALIEAGRYDAVVSDLRMPGIDGFDVMARVNDRFPGVPVIVMTGYMDHGTPVPPNVVGLLRKPFRLAEMEELLASSLNTRRIPAAHPTYERG